MPVCIQQIFVAVIIIRTSPDKLLLLFIAVDILAFKLRKTVKAESLITLLFTVINL